MYTLTRVCAVVLFSVWMPVALAQATSVKPAEGEQEKREQVKQESAEAMAAIRSYSIERRDEAVARARQSAEEIDRSIERLQMQMDQRWESMSKAARTSSQQTMANLRQRRNNLADSNDDQKQ